MRHAFFFLIIIIVYMIHSSWSSIFFFFLGGHGPWTGLFNVFHHGNKILGGGGEQVSANKCY